MGPVNWIGVVLSALAGVALSLLWFGPLFGRAKVQEVGPGRLAGRRTPGQAIALTMGALLISSAMMGHMFARIGQETLQAKPWLYFMQAGGLALAFVFPAVWVSYKHMRCSNRLAMIDGGYWVAAYLTMGTVYWLLG